MKKKSFFTTLKEYWNIPRYHGLISIALYFIFFLIIYLLAQPWGNSSPKITQPTLSTPYTVTYDFKKLTANQVTEDVFQLEVTEQDMRLTYQNKGDIYQIKNNQIMGSGVELSEVLPIAITGILPESLLQLIANKSPNSSGTFQDGTLKKEYEIKANEVPAFTPQNKQYLLITTFQKGTNMEKINLDITNALEDTTILSYNIEVKFES